MKLIFVLQTVSLYTYMALIDQYIKTINERYFNSAKLEELTQLWNTMDDKVKPPTVVKSNTTCVFVFKRGDKAGTICGKKCMKGDTCSLHTKKENSVEKPHQHKDAVPTTIPVETVPTKEKKTENACPFVFKRGEKAGTICGKKFMKGDACSLHTKKEVVEKDSVKEEKVSKPKKKTEEEEDTGPCKNIVKNGDQKGQVCGNTDQTCKHFQPIRLSRVQGTTLRVIKDTWVVFDPTKQTVNGHLTSDGVCVHEENDQVREMCLKYDLVFVAPKKTKV